jgi:hypothetical protein
MLPGSGFLATLSFMLHFKNRHQPTRATRRFRSGLRECCLNPNDGDAMINDAGKQPVKETTIWLPAAREFSFLSTRPAHNGAA